MPKQVIGTMDCGVCMMCMVGLYVAKGSSWLLMAASLQITNLPTSQMPTLFSNMMQLQLKE
jgi:hypothetical protein